MTFSRAAVAEAEAAMRAEMGEQQVLLDRQVGHDVLAAAVLGDEADAGPHRLRRLPRVDELAADRDGAGAARAEAEDRFHRLRPAGADQAAEAEDFALLDGEGNVAHEGRRVQVGDFQGDRRRPAFSAVAGARS